MQMPRHAQQLMADFSEVRLGPQGRIVIPAEMRRALGVEEGDTLVAWTESGRLVLETQASLLQRLQDHFATLAPDMSLSAELIAERREEAQREADECY
jgi:AbrB family looped-hinge helix DNA binding protein